MTASVTPNAGLVTETLLSQYANSPTIVAMLNDMDSWIDPTADIDQFYDVIWNIQTARGFGLDIWGRIVGVTRYLKIPSQETYFGFDEAYTEPTASTGVQPFGQAPFYNGTPANSQTYALTDDAFRTLILAKAASNISDGTAASVNNLLLILFADRGRCYCNDLGNMQMRLTFEFSLQPFEQSILLQSGVIPKPAGVQLFIIEINNQSVFGFAEMGSGVTPFNQGVFFTGMLEAS